MNTINKPIKAVDEESHVIFRNATVMAHVPVVGQHQNWNAYWDFGKLPPNVVESPVKIVKIIFWSYLPITISHENNIYGAV